MIEILAEQLRWTARTFAGAAMFAGGVGGLIWVSLSPESQIWGPLIARGPATIERQVALTFDDGPTAGSTERILDTLNELSAPATFFVVGVNVQKHPALVRRMYEEGHLVANHSWNHSHFGFFCGPGYWDGQIGRTNDLIEQITGERPTFFRPPMGMKTSYIMAAARRAGQRVVTWSTRAMDGIATTPERICQRLIEPARSGDILLLHDGVDPHLHRDTSASIAAVRPLVLSLRARGFKIVRLDELLGCSHAQPTPGMKIAQRQTLNHNNG